MKRIGWSILVLTIILTACGNPTPAVVSPASPALVEETIITSSSDVAVASATVVPVQVSELGFTISALVKEVKVKEGDKVQAGDTLIVLYTPELEFAVVAAEEDYNSKSLAAELQKAEKVKYVNPNTGKIRWYSLPREVYLKALSKADQSKALLESAQANLAQTILTAPHTGVVASINVIPGELVQVDQAVITLATLDNLQIQTTDLSEHDIANVKIGQSVDVYIEALDVTVTGKVTRISPIAESVGGDVVYPVTIELDEQPDGLLWGMTAEVQIQTK